MDDPGWRHLLWAVVPLYGRWRLARQELSGLERLRVVMFSFVSAILLIGWVIAIVVGSDRKLPQWTYGLFALAVPVWGLNSVLRRRPLNFTNPIEFARTYRSTFFRQVAIAESAALICFVVAFVVRNGWAYAPGALVALGGFFLAAPTRENLTLRREQIRESGQQFDPIEALGLDGTEDGRP